MRRHAALRRRPAAAALAAIQGAYFALTGVWPLLDAVVEAALAAAWLLLSARRRGATASRALGRSRAGSP